IALSCLCGTHSQVVEGLKDALVGAVRTAGVALQAVYGFPSDEPLPVDGNASAIASFVAKLLRYWMTSRRTSLYFCEWQDATSGRIKLPCQPESLISLKTRIPANRGGDFGRGA